MGKLTKREQENIDVSKAYEEKFGECFPIWWTLQEHLSIEDETKLMLRCIDEGEPFEPRIPGESEEQWEYFRVRNAYRRAFNNDFCTAAVPYMSLKEMTELMRRCIEEGKPYVFDLPEGALI